MVLGVILGAGIGMLTGVTVGSVIFGSTDAKCFKHLDEAADSNAADGAVPKGNEVREILELSPHWTKWPDYERVAWMNRMIATLWPHYNQAVANIVHETVTPILDETCQNSKLLSAITIEKMKLGGIKTYETREDEVIIEAPVLWGSNADIRVHLSLQLLPLRIFIPVTVKNVQLHAVARITIRPLVETLPCLGALHISLLNPPHIDMTLNLINNMDFMALPGVKEIASNIVQGILSKMMLYPNQFSVDLMEGGGLPPAPVGMLRVNLVRIENLKKSDLISKSDSYCLLEVREGRPQRSTTVKNSQNPVFNEEFLLIVDDQEEQNLRITVKDDDFGWSDHTFGVCTVKLSDLECFERPRETILISGDLIKEEATGLLASSSKSMRRLTSMMSSSKKGMATNKSMGKVFLELTMFPFFRPGVDGAADSSDDEDARANAGGSPASRSFGTGTFASMHSPSMVREDMKGLLTITLTRCLNLAGRDTYVLFSLHDNITKKTEIQKSSYVLNDDSPRWGDKFDFVMINADSHLTVRVMEKPGFMESMMSMKFAKRGDDKSIGVIRIPVADLVRNVRLKDTWALQEVQQGEIELTLTWTTCEFA